MKRQQIGKLPVGTRVKRINTNDPFVGVVAGRGPGLYTPNAEFIYIRITNPPDRHHSGPDGEWCENEWVEYEVLSTPIEQQCNLKNVIIIHNELPIIYFAWLACYDEDRDKMYIKTGVCLKDSTGERKDTIFGMDIPCFSENYMYMSTIIDD